MSRVSFQQQFQFSPITLIGGIAQNMNGGALPILTLLQPGAFPNGITGGSNIDVNNIFAHFEPAQPILIDNDAATYPLANQVVAANAQIVKPLRVSLIMKCPANSDTNYEAKLGVMTALQQKLQQHTLSGGTYNVATPCFLYANCLLMRLQDVSNSVDDGGQAQTIWQWDFFQPLLTVAQANQAQSTLMSKLSSGAQVQGKNGEVKWSGPDNTVGQPNSLAMPYYLPSGTASGASGVSGQQGTA